MKASLITSHKDVSPEGFITEFLIWRVPKPVPPCSHTFKYSLVLIVNGDRVVGFDNERGKGDHYHLDDLEYDYNFVDMKTLVEDFILEVKKWKSAH